VQLIGHRDGLLHLANHLLDCKLRLLGALASASPDPAELRSQYAGLVSAQHAMAVVAFNREVDDDFLTVDVDRLARLASH
jgi:hypothetical protein